MAIFAVAIVAQAQTYTILHNFTGFGDGSVPEAGVTLDRAGNLYGTTFQGTVFKLSHAGSGWVLATLYTFQGGSDGARPASRVIFGPDGTLYGTTSEGGSNGLGTVYNLRPPASVCRSTACPWSETILHNFTGGDGAAPQLGDLVFDGAGNIYGTTSSGGASGQGVVFELSPSGAGWTESVLYNFAGGRDGAVPYSGVTFDAAGNLYGTTTLGGAHSVGTVYELTASQSGWSETTLFAFDGSDHSFTPYGGVIFDRQGNLYGTACGGPNDGGTVYELAAGDGGWAYNLAYGFSGYAGPRDAPTMDASGNIFLTNLNSGFYQAGSVYQLTPGAGGWTATDLYDFNGASTGAAPFGNVTLDAAGYLYGTTTLGGTHNLGVVFEITP
jgi:uncharacterized repeat protein (TIGR03803 family)